MNTCKHCLDNENIVFYEKKSFQNVDFFDMYLCIACFYTEQAIFHSYKAYVARVERFANIHCPDIFKDKYTITIEFNSKD